MVTETGDSIAINLLSSVQFSRSVVSNSLWPHELQHARPPCPSPTPRVHPNPCPSNRWCHPIISSSVVPFSSCPQPHQGLFQWVSSWYQVAKVLELQLQHQSSQWTPRTDLCLLICLILASWAAQHLPAHLPDTRQPSLATPACSSDW